MLKLRTAFFLSLLFLLGGTTAKAHDFGHLAVTLANLFQMSARERIPAFKVPGAEEKFSREHLDVISSKDGGTHFIQTRFTPPADYAVVSWDQGVVYKLKAASLKANLAQILSSLKNSRSEFRTVWQFVSLLEDLAVIKLNNVSGVIIIDFGGAEASLGSGRHLDTTGWRFGLKNYFGDVDDSLLEITQEYLRQIFAQRDGAEK
jgi:hypothetical protein